MSGNRFCGGAGDFVAKDLMQRARFSQIIHNGASAMGVNVTDLMGSQVGKFQCGHKIKAGGFGILADGGTLCYIRSG